MRQNIGLKRHMLPWMATAGLGATLLGTTPAQAEPAGEAPAAAEQTAATAPATPTPEQGEARERSRGGILGAIRRGIDQVSSIGRSRKESEGSVGATSEGIRADAARDEPVQMPEGLTSEEVRRLTDEGKTNSVKDKGGRSYFRIIADNLFTFFNLIWAIIAAVLVLVESYGSLTFLIVVVLNLVVAIFQESRAKHAVEKLSLATDPKATVVRDGQTVQISSASIVLGDVVRLEMGRQVPCDGVVLTGRDLEHGGVERTVIAYYVYYRK
jgi:magnesium-transporting ATPase (P-type)